MLRQEWGMDKANLATRTSKVILADRRERALDCSLVVGDEIGWLGKGRLFARSGCSQVGTVGI
jgi:hypothetical protein